VADNVLMKVPREWAADFDKIAEEEGLTTRGRWAVKARTALKEFLDDYNFKKKGSEKDAAPAEDDPLIGTTHTKRLAGAPA